MVSISISSGSPPTQTTISVAAGELTLPASNYIRIEFYCDNGTSIRVDQVDNGGTINNYRSPVATFEGLTPGKAYSFRVDVQRFSGSEISHAGPINQMTDPADETVVGPVDSISSYNVISNAFSITWSAASGANGYQIYRRILGQTDWNISYEGSTAYRFTGLPSETYFEVKVRGYTGDVYGGDSPTLLVRTQSNAPSDLAWPTFTVGQDSLLLTAKNWNDLTSKINAWRTYRGLTSSSFTVAYPGNYVTATIFNQAAIALIDLNPPTTPPQQVSAGDVFAAAKINALGNAIDSIN